MNYDSQWRLELGKRAAAIYAQNHKLAALVVAGSVGRGWADEWSDIELDLFWHEPPTDDDRKSVIQALNGALVYYYPLEEDEWSDAYFVDGLKFEVSSFLASTLGRYIADVIENHDTATEKHLRLAALQNSIPLVGTDLIQGWRASIAAYPEPVAEKIIRDNIDFGGWNSVEFAFARGDLLMAYDLMAKTQKQVMTVLLALNRIYMGHPRGKWLRQFADAMRFKPANLAERLLFALRAGSVEGAQSMNSVLAETFDLVADQFPHIDLTDIKKDVWFRRIPLTPEKHHETA